MQFDQVQVTLIVKLNAGSLLIKALTGLQLILKCTAFLIHLTFSYLNINSIGNRFDPIQRIVMVNVYILIVAETKIEAPFPTEQFSDESIKTRIFCHKL